METIRKQNSIVKRENISELESTKRSRKSVMIEREAYFSHLAIVLTEKCNIFCRHCMSNCLPFQKAELGWTVIERLIRESAALRSIKWISFTGGESFLELDTLVNAVNLCKVLGLKVSVVTNGFWAVSVNIAKQTLEKLDGLTVLSVSTDIFHQEFVPIDRIHNTILSCNELGIDCQVCVCYLNDPVSEIESIKEQLARVEGLYKLSPQPVVPLGRAASQIDINSIYSYDPTGMLCESADKPLVDSTGNVFACCGPTISPYGNQSLFLGNIHNQTLEEIRNSADLNPIIHALRLWGPSKLVDIIQKEAEKEGYTFVLPRMDEIHCMCSLCEYIFTNPKHAEILHRAVKNTEVWHEIAVERLIELGEISMILEE